jgi:hypothetical protein
MASFQIFRWPAPRSAFGPKRRKLARDADFAQAQKSRSSKVSSLGFRRSFLSALHEIRSHFS